jgi:DNA-binding transcriptional MerR regulator
VGSTLAIGDFSRATHLSIKTLRHYHQIGLLAPAAVDPGSGYRRYDTDQIPVAQIIRRFRALDMPLDEIHAVLTAPDVATRNERIAAHLTRLESSLERTQAVVASLRDLLEHRDASTPIAHRRVAATTAAAISDIVDLADAELWYYGALGELRATLAAQGAPVAAPAGGIYAAELFAEERGHATVFLPCDEPLRATGRVRGLRVPAVELATIVHAGPHSGLDRAYGALGSYVARHALAVDGPLREYYLVGPLDTVDQSAWRTEIGWPIFQTR